MIVHAKSEALTIHANSSSGHNLFLLLVATILATDTNRIFPGDRLEIRFAAGKSNSLDTSTFGTLISIVQSNGTVLLGESTHIKLQGLTMSEATNAIRGALYITWWPDREQKTGTARSTLILNTNVITSSDIRKIKQVPPPLALSVYQKDASNYIYRLTNNTTNSYRIPSAGYALGGFYIGANTNPAYAYIEKSSIQTGLWLTYDWRYVGSDWMWASREMWEERLQIKSLKPDETIEISRPITDWSGWQKKDEKPALVFTFEVPQDWSERYDLWEGSLCVTGLTAKPNP